MLRNHGKPRSSWVQRAKDDMRLHLKRHHKPAIQNQGNRNLEILERASSQLRQNTKNEVRRFRPEPKSRTVKLARVLARAQTDPVEIRAQTKTYEITSHEWIPYEDGHPEIPLDG
jgi:hypothetical protein